MKPAIVLMILGLTAPLVAGAQDSPALEQMRAAAEHGNADAQLEMGILYEFGYNMPKNDINALAWYLRSADQGNVLAAKRRDQIKSSMKPDEIEAAQKFAQGLAAQKPQTKTPPPATEPPPAPPSVTSPTLAAPLADPPNVEKSSSAP